MGLRAAVGSSCAVWNCWATTVPPSRLRYATCRSSEGQEDNEPEQDSKPRRDHAEDPCGAIAVDEVAAPGAVRRTRSIAVIDTAAATTTTPAQRRFT